MNGRNRDRQAGRLPIRARRPEESSTPERLEENLRRLIKVAMPEAKASDALLQRVRALAEAQHAWLDAQRDARDEARHWQGLETALTDQERELLSRLLTADLGQLREDEALRAEAKQVTERLLEGLPAPVREALLLHLVQELPTPEIAQVLGCSEGDAAWLLQQARESIFHQAGRVYRDQPEN